MNDASAATAATAVATAVGTDEADAGFTLRRRLAWRRMPGVIKGCICIGVVLALAALFAPWVAPHDPVQTQILLKLKAPLGMEGYETGHWLGTDQLGRDLLSRCIHGIRVSVGIALLGLIVSAVVGTLAGLVSGLVGGWVDRVVMMVVDVFITVPFLLLVLVGIAAFGSDIPVLILLVGLARWETYARIVRGQVLQVREMPFIEASRALGASTTWIAVKHVLPNIASPLIVLLTLNFPSILLLESSLSFLGIGVQPPTASLGRMVGDGRDHLIFAWWVAVAPALVIVTITFIVQMLGDWLRDVLDVKVDD
ncbi:MAG: ABC transporter permease [Rubrivivax sp.]|nr:ABC transporter permease [Rubrivivax sp.]